MATSTAPDTGVTVDVLVDAARDRARAEAREMATMMALRDTEMARTAHVEPPMRRHVERSAIALMIAEATGLSEGQVVTRMSAADTVRDQSPTTWSAFTNGLIDWARVREIAATITVLKRADSIHRLDARVLDFATGHTTAELRHWLARFVRRVEADLAVERADDAREGRHVSIRHGEDSMASLYAYLPSHEAAAIAARLRTETRKPANTNEPGDTRTLPQREADVLVAWCLGANAATSAIDANIAVMIDADVLAGAHPGLAEAADRSWAVPATWIADVAARGGTFWNRIVRQPVTGDVLSHEYLGRFCPDTLKTALQFLHGTCQSPGCMVPAQHCDIDHRQPWPTGPTTADNLGPLCRRHHTYKGHGLLRWTTRPPQPAPTNSILELHTRRTLMHYTAA